LILLNAYDLPKELFSAVQQGSTFENQKEAYKRYLQSGAQNIADVIAETFGEYYGIKIGASCEHLPVMQEDERKKAELKKMKIETYEMAFRNSGINQEEFTRLVQNELQ